LALLKKLKKQIQNSEKAKKIVKDQISWTEKFERRDAKSSTEQRSYLIPFTTFDCSGSSGLMMIDDGIDL